MALRAVPEHPKFARLKKSLALSKFEALGLLETLWHFTGKFSPRGNVGKFTDSEIESWLEWEGEPGFAIAALLEAGWLENHQEHRLIVHDWKDHADSTTKKQVGRKQEEFVQTSIGQVQDVSNSDGKRKRPPEPAPVPETVPDPVPVPGADREAAIVKIILAHPRSIQRKQRWGEESKAQKDAVLQAMKDEIAYTGFSESDALEGILFAVERHASAVPEAEYKFIKDLPEYFRLHEYRQEIFNTGAKNGTFKGKTESTLDAATSLIEKIERSAAAHEAQHSETGEAGGGRSGSLLGRPLALPAG